MASYEVHLKTWKMCDAQSNLRMIYVNSSSINNRLLHFYIAQYIHLIEIVYKLICIHVHFTPKQRYYTGMPLLFQMQTRPQTNVFC